MYNVKIKDYGNGQVQTRIYSHLVYTGEKEKPEKQEDIFNPFDGEKVKEVRDFNEFEKSRTSLRLLAFAFGLVMGLNLVGFWVIPARVAHSERFRSHTSLLKYFLEAACTP